MGTPSWVSVNLTSSLGEKVIKSEQLRRVCYEGRGILATLEGEAPPSEPKLGLPGASAPPRRQGHSSGATLKAASGPLYPSSVVDVLEILPELINSMLSVIPMLEGTKNPEELHPQV